MSFFNFKDLADSKNQNVIFTHIATGKTISFPGIISNFQDRYAVAWSSQQIFGRNDPVKPYQSTTRSLSFDLTILSDSLENSIQNLESLQIFAQMMYPMYSKPLSGKGSSFGRTIKAPPLMRVRFVNMIKSADGDGPLLCCIDGFNYSPSSEAGYFVAVNGDVFPKEVKLSLTMTPQHESVLGWDSETSEFITDTFPYSVTTPELNEDDASGENPSLESASDDKLLS